MLFPKKNNGAEPPSGLMMLLKTMVPDFDPQALTRVVSAVEEIRSRLQSIEEKVDFLASEMEPKALEQYLIKFKKEHFPISAQNSNEKGTLPNAVDRCGKEVAGRTESKRG